MYTMARKSMSLQVMEREKRARSILEGLHNVSDPIPQELIRQALIELDGIKTLCYTAGGEGRAQRDATAGVDGRRVQIPPGPKTAVKTAGRDTLAPKRKAKTP